MDTLALVGAPRKLATSRPAARDLAEGQGEKKHVPLPTLSFGAPCRADDFLDRGLETTPLPEEV